MLGEPQTCIIREPHPPHTVGLDNSTGFRCPGKTADALPPVPQPTMVTVCDQCTQPWGGHLRTARERASDAYYDSLDAHEHSDSTDLMAARANAQVDMRDCLLAMKAALVGPVGPQGAMGSPGYPGLTERQVEQIARRVVEAGDL